MGPCLSDHAGLLALVTGKREASPGTGGFPAENMSSCEILCVPRVSSVVVKHKGTKWRSTGLG